MDGRHRPMLPRFFFWNALGGITWATTVALVVYFGGQAAKDVITKVGFMAPSRWALSSSPRLHQGPGAAAARVGASADSVRGFP